MKQAIEYVVEYFTHPSLKKDGFMYEKSKLIIIVLLIVFLMLFLYTCYFLFNGMVINEKALENYVACIATIICLFVLKRTGYILFPLYFLACMGYLFVTASAYMSGGIYSNDISWYFVIPVITLMFIGLIEGIVASFISLLFTTLFYVLEINHHKNFITDSIEYGLGYKFANSFFILTLLILVMYILVRSNKKMQKIIQFNREQQLREDIARDFHDQIGNKLASIQHLSNLTAMNKSEDEKLVLLTKISNNAKEVYDNFKDFIWTKDPQSDQLKEIFMYLRDYAEDYLKHSSINLFINSSPDILPEINVPPNWSHQIVPIFKEIITNAQKHSEAKNIYIDFSLIGNILEIKIKDDGKGIENLNNFKGKGITNLKHRAETIGASLAINSENENGTQIIFKAQLPFQGSIKQ
jgi:signal transduction histidine kinase